MQATYWNMRVGPIRLTRVTVVEDAPWRPFDAAPALPSPTRVGAVTGWRMAIVVTLALSTAGYAVAPKRGGTRDRYVVTALIPPASKPRAKADAAPPRVRPSKRMAIADAAPDGQVSEGASLSAAIEPERAAPASKVAAIDIAAKTGEMQHWAGRDGEEDGFVVAGSIEQGADGECRSLAILTRRHGEADRVDHQRRCG